MNLQSVNKNLASQIVKALHFAFTLQLDNDVQTYYSHDTDFVQYRIQSKKLEMSLYFKCPDIQTIYNYGHKYMIAKYFKTVHCALVDANPSSGHKKQLKLTIDNDILTSFNTQFKKTPEGQLETGILTGKKKFDGLFQYVSKKIATIKRHFYAAPFEMMLQTAADNNKLKQGHKILPNLSFYLRYDRKEKVWLSFQKIQFTVYYGINFEDRSEQQLARILFSELVDAKKHVQNSPAVALSELQLPKFLIDAFPQQKTSKYHFSNGIISFTLFGSLVRNASGMASFLSGFRTYAYYHIQASKCYLHSRVLKRIQKCHKDLTLAEIQPFTNK